MLVVFLFLAIVQAETYYLQDGKSAISKWKQIDVVHHEQKIYEIKYPMIFEDDSILYDLDYNPLLYEIINDSDTYFNNTHGMIYYTRLRSVDTILMDKLIGFLYRYDIYNFKRQVIGEILRIKTSKEYIILELMVI